MDNIRNLLGYNKTEADVNNEKEAKQIDKLEAQPLTKQTPPPAESATTSSFSSIFGLGGKRALRRKTHRRRISRKRKTHRRRTNRRRSKLHRPRK